MDNQINTDLLHALQGIQDELKRMNQTLSSIAQKRPTEASAPATSYRSESSRPYGAAGRVGGGRSSGPTARTGRFAKDGEPSKEGSAESAGNRFPKKKGSTRSSAGPARPKGKLPPKKGNGYPKKNNKI